MNYNIEFINALARKDYVRAEEIINEQTDINQLHWVDNETEGMKGTTKLYFAAYYKQIKLFYMLIINAPRQVVNSIISDGEHAGSSLFCLVIEEGEIHMINFLTSLVTLESVFSIARSSKYYGKSAASLLVQKNKWHILEKTLKDNVSKIDNFIPTLNENNKSFAMLWWLIQNRQWETAKKICSLVYEETVKSRHLIEKITGGSIEQRFKYYEQLTSATQKTIINKDTLETKSPTPTPIPMLIIPEFDLVFNFAPTPEPELTQNYEIMPDYDATLDSMITRELSLTPSWEIENMFTTKAVNVTSQNINPPVLWAYLLNGKFELANNIFADTSLIDRNYVAMDGQFKNRSVLWFAALCKQWEMVRKLIPNATNESMDTIPTEGIGSNYSVLALLLNHKEYDLALMLKAKGCDMAKSLENVPNKNIFESLLCFSSNVICKILNDDSKPSLKCPISGKLMLYPVVAADHYAYDLPEILLYFAMGGKVSKKTGEILSNFDITPIHAILTGLIADRIQQIGLKITALENVPITPKNAVATLEIPNISPKNANMSHKMDTEKTLASTDKRPLKKQKIG